MKYQVLLCLALSLLLYWYYRNYINIESFVPGKACTNELALNFKDPIKLSSNEVSDECTCEWPTDKVACARYFAINYQNAKYPNEHKRCHDKNAYNFELNSKIPDNNICIYENNNTCIFPTTLSNVNSLFEIIDNPDEYVTLINADGSVNYNNILRAGPCISKNSHRSEKLELYYRLFNRNAIDLPLSTYDPIFNVWDLAGKVTQKQFNEGYGKILRTYDFVEDGLSTTIEVQGYGVDIPLNANYYDIVNALNNNMLSDRVKHIALAVSLDCSKYAIGIASSKDAAMDIAMMNAILFDANTADINDKLEVNRSYSRTINLFKKAHLMSLDKYDKIKQDIAEQRIVAEEDNILIAFRDKIIENVNNPVAILMLNNERYFKYPNDGKILDKCIDAVKNIESKCFNDVDINGVRNCNEVVMLRHDSKNDKCSIVQQHQNVIKNSKYDLSHDVNIKEMSINTPIKIVNSLLSDAGCGRNDINCFIYSINDKRFCKGTS
jgi:hypothetical protein